MCAQNCPVPSHYNLKEVNNVFQESGVKFYCCCFDTRKRNFSSPESNGPLQIKRTTARELLCKWPPTKHPVSYFSGENEMNRERKNNTQEWMRASILTSRVPFHALPHLRRWAHTDQYSVYSRLSLCQTKVAKALEKMDTVSGPTGLQGVEMPAGFSPARLGWWDPSTWTAWTSGSKNKAPAFLGTRLSRPNEWCFDQFSGC